ncbi:hypothetical protein C1I95_05515 [Micromonospora craterilacus]|uniref:Uncharacterized protein n=1 Tax=Micromonospora craterilacus TaxID=1655439 RepID=A0A2W2FAA3_9ACTN|nr:hypothetical protein C1I95_05515 [Micromonospora craterilacus]
MVDAVARVVAPVTEAARDQVVAPVAAAVRPVLDPLVDALSQLLGPLSPLLDPIVAGLDPILREAGPILGPLDPVLDILDPVAGLPQPPPATPPAAPDPDPDSDPEFDSDPAPQPAPLPTWSPASPAVDVSPCCTPPGAPVAADTVRHGSAYPAMPRPRAVGATGTGAPDPVDRQPDHTPTPFPVSPAPGTSGVDSTVTTHGGTADNSPVGWTPPPLRGQVTRPARTPRRPSRSPRPGSRPA